MNRRWRLFTSSCRRALRWEFWPVWAVYSVPAFYIAWLLLRYRGMSFTAVNPLLPGSGFVGEKKSIGLRAFNAVAPEFVADFAIIAQADSLEKRLLTAKQFMASRSLEYPVVLKPDDGQRGLDVEVIRSAAELESYLSDIKVDTLIQEHIEGLEFGVFYTGFPATGQGAIFSLTEKHFPVLTGDGQRTLEQLILDDRRTHFMARYLLDLHAGSLHWVPAEGERFKTVEIGSHCRGSLFLDGAAKITPELEQRIHSLSQAAGGFYFGRFDIRAASLDCFQRGDAFKILEVNGVTSEATHIYDPRHSVWYGWKTLCKQWRLAFEIGEQNRRRGERGMGLGELITKVRGMNS